MKDNSSRRAECVVDDPTLSEIEDEAMESSEEELLDLAELTRDLEDGELDIHEVAERLTSLLGRCSSPVTMTTEEESELSLEEDEDEEGDQWEPELSPHDRSLILAGYNNCMDEAIRFLVEEEQFSEEHPVVQGLKEHLLSQQERLELDSSRAAVNGHFHYTVYVQPSVVSSTSPPAQQAVLPSNGVADSGTDVATTRGVAGSATTALLMDNRCSGSNSSVRFGVDDIDIEYN